jgi:hypothetical protein
MTLKCKNCKNAAVNMVYVTPVYSFFLTISSIMQDRHTSYRKTKVLCNSNRNYNFPLLLHWNFLRSHCVVVKLQSLGPPPVTMSCILSRVAQKAGNLVSSQPNSCLEFTVLEPQAFYCSGKTVSMWNPRISRFGAWHISSYATRDNHIVVITATWCCGVKKV